MIDKEKLSAQLAAAEDVVAFCVVVRDGKGGFEVFTTKEVPRRVVYAMRGLAGTLDAKNVAPAEEDPRFMKWKKLWLEEWEAWGPSPPKFKGGFLHGHSESGWKFPLYAIVKQVARCAKQPWACVGPPPPDRPARTFVDSFHSSRHHVRKQHNWAHWNGVALAVPSDYRKVKYPCGYGYGAGEVAYATLRMLLWEAGYIWPASKKADVLAEGSLWHVHPRLQNVHTSLVMQAGD